MVISRDVKLLYPMFAYKLESAVKIAQKNGYDVHIFEAWRSPLRQDELKKSTPKVTNASGWHSWHQYGLAADIAFGGEGRWHWNGDFKAVHGIFSLLKLAWGGEKDAGHYQYNLGLTIEDAIKIRR